MKKRLFHSNAVLLTVLCCIISAPQALASHEPVGNYSRLVELIRLEERHLPFFVFSGFERAFDTESHEASLEYIKENPDIKRKIETDLDGGASQWELSSLSYRLMFVPELRDEYAGLFENYCHVVIDDVLNMTGLPNPYCRIVTLGGEQPEPLQENGGITAFLVHNLAKEYVASYVFSNQQHKKVSVGLRGTVFSGEIGSFSSYLYIKEDGTVEFTHDRHTIWQNSARNPYTALMTPIEETLHIVLREYTESAIREDIVLGSVTTLESMERIVENWISLEEAVVGGLACALVPDLLKKYGNSVPDAWIEADIESKSRFEKYRFLKQGIRIVKNLGYKQALKLYQNHVRAFRDMFSPDYANNNSIISYPK
jgi:hypothetical protein